MKSNSVASIIRGGVWLYASMIVNNLSGFIYWLLISRIAGSYVLGKASATIGLATLINGILSLGIGLGLQHFIGLCMRDNDVECIREKYWSMIHFSAVIYGLTGLTLVIIGLSGLSIGGYTPEMFIAASLLVLSGFLPMTSSLPISMLRTDIVFKSVVLGNILKVSIGVLLVYMGIGYWGVVIGYVLLQVIQLLYTLIYALYSVGYKPLLKMSIIREVVKGSIVSWIPSVILLAGQWLGVLAVFGSSGAVETGYYYIAFTLANFILGIGASILSLLLPVLSSMHSGRIDAVNRVLRITLSLLIPISLYLAVYPYILLGLLGGEYLNASTELSILLLNSLPVMIISSINSYVYSRREYVKVLYLGLSQSLPRILSYFILVPRYSSLGAAYSYTLGSYIGLAYTLYLVKKDRIKLHLKIFSTIFVIALLFISPLYLFRIEWIPGLIVLLTIYLIYYKASFISRDDLYAIFNALKFWK